ncbi:PAS domain S-box protein [Polyangium sorediatum]|uniref:histidine kinase n=1 Tax=Polyangium sorediatum TaxID=889274 RepID=A0ABT6P1G5_9BACT|nr:PAS domain S-box protein [Polyangium sorediatum]MDI1434408.1 PAS domain S-box protein [Polyangium sorediatum]
MTDRKNEPPSSKSKRFLWDVLSRYGVAVAVTAGTVALCLSLQAVIDTPALLLLLVLAVAVAAHGGFGPGLAATGMAALAGMLLLRPLEGLAVALFVAVGLVLSTLGECIHRSLAATRRGNAVLERRIQERTAELESLFLHAPVGFAFFDREGRFLRVNDWLAAINGLPVEAHLGRPPHEVLPHITVTTALHDVFQTGEPIAHLEISGETPARPGETRHWLDAIFPVHGPEGTVTSVGAVILDVTEMKRATEQARARARQQAAVAALGHMALVEKDVQRIMNRAVELVAETLEIELCKVLELIPGGQRLLLRAGVGWATGLVGHATVGADDQSQAGYTLRSNVPVIVEDLRTEPRFHGPPLLHDHGVVSGMSVTIAGEQDQPYGVLGAHTRRKRLFTRDDITFLESIAILLAASLRQRQVERALREGEERYRLLVEGVRDYAIYMLDPEGRVQSWNAGAERLKGYTAAEVIGRHFSQFYPAEDVAQGKPERSLILAARHGRFEEEGFHVRKDGTRFWANVVLTALRDETGALRGFSNMTRDVTERKQAIEAARNAAARLRAIVDTAVDGIITIDDHGTIETTNPAAERMLGYGTNELVGRNVKTIMPEPYRSGHDTYLANYLRTGVRKIIGIGRKVRGRRKDGSEFPLDLAVSEFFVGERRFFAGIIRDITERAAAEAERESLLGSERAARSEAERANRMKDEFLATMSHELRTPLTPILGWIELLRTSQQAPQNLEKGLSVIERNARLQLQLISDLLDVSRIVSGKLRLHVQRVDLPKVIDAAIESVRHAAEVKGIAIRAAYEPADTTVMGDPDRLQQVVWNLVANAIKFTPKKGRVDIRLSRTNAHLRLAVTDTGQGIAPEFLPLLFDRFRQADSSTSRRHGGLGLGLSIVKHLVELHGGCVHAESAGLGKGATFVVDLPTMPAVAPGPEHDTRPLLWPNLARAPVADTPSLEGIRVLVVDDEPDARELVERLLEDRRAKVITAASAFEALDLLNNPENEPDVMVSDLGMPGMDGFALIREVRARGAAGLGDLPAVAVTAFARPEDKARSLEAGYDAHVTKPIDPLGFVATVAQVTRRKRAVS